MGRLSPYFIPNNSILLFFEFTITYIVRDKLLGFDLIYLEGMMIVTSKQKSRIYRFLLDKRKHARFVVKPGVNVMTSDKCTLLGPLIDISQGGLAFHYINTDFQAYNESAICLAAPKDDLFMDNLTIKTVYDVEVSSNEDDDILVERRCGAQFLELIPEQVLQLDRLITVYTLEPG